MVEVHGGLAVERASVLVDGRERTFTVVRPAQALRNAPVVLVFHGSNQNGATIRRFAGGAFDRFAERGAVVAYLDGHRRNWNDARVSSAFAARTEGFDDVAFTQAVIDFLGDDVDTGRVHVVGYSAGGSMVIRLVHEMPDRLAGAGIIAATLPVPENFLTFTAPVVPLPVVLFHGTKDRLVPYDGGMTSLWGFRPRGLGVSARRTAEHFAERNGITTPPTSQETGRDGRTVVERTEYRQDGRPPVVLHTIHGGGHVVPGSTAAPFIMGRSTRSLAAEDALGEVFGL